MSEVVVLLKQTRHVVEVLVDGKSCGSIVDVRPYNRFPTTALDVIEKMIQYLDINARVEWTIVNESSTPSSY